MENTESQIIASCQNGNFERFAELYDSYAKKIYNFIYYRTHHKPTAEDITSLVFIKALENIQSYKASKGSFAAWLYQIARNSIIDHYRAHREHEDIESAFDIPSSANVERDADVSRQMESLKKHLAGLPKVQRDIVIMRVWDGLTHKEIAEILGMTEGNVKVTFSRVVAKMNKELVMALVMVMVVKSF